MDNQVMQWVDGLTDEAKKKLQTYYELLVEWNQKMNLTGITDRTEVYVKHFWDSVQIERLPEWADLRTSSQVIDVGTGAGFPGVPLAVTHPAHSYLLLDSLRKRLAFLEECAGRMKLNNVTIVHGRAEDMARLPGYRGCFDVAVSRAVARLNVLLELTLPFVRPGGYFVAYKGPSVKEELGPAERAAKRLGAELVRVESFDVPGLEGGRRLVLFRQRMASPSAYPRKAGTPQKSPLS